VKNVSDVEREYSIASWLDDIIKLERNRDNHRPGFTHIEVGPKISNKPSRTFSLNIPELEEHGATHKNEEKGAIDREEGVINLQLRTGPIKPNEIWYVRIDGTQIMRTEDHFVWNLITLTQKLDIFIELSGGLTFDQLSVYPREMHHIGHKAFLDTRDNSTPNTWKMKIDHVLLPFQGVEIRWAPKPVQ